MISAFKKAMQELAATVSVITTAHDGVRDGLTATSVCSLSVEPASILVCINKECTALDLIKRQGFFCLNVLSQDQQALSDIFAGRTGAKANQRFSEYGQWSTSEQGIPMLDGALANVVCELDRWHDNGSHDICIGIVHSIRLNGGRLPLIYAKQKYCTLADLS